MRQVAGIKSRESTGKERMINWQGGGLEMARAQAASGDVLWLAELTPWSQMLPPPWWHLVGSFETCFEKGLEEISWRRWFSCAPAL
jgi:hypothetical protein